MAAMSRSSVMAALRDLQDEGFIVLAHRRVILRDVEALLRLVAAEGT
jgi:hypothetical protein